MKITCTLSQLNSLFLTRVPLQNIIILHTVNSRQPRPPTQCTLTISHSTPDKSLHHLSICLQPPPSPATKSEPFITQIITPFHSENNSVLSATHIISTVKYTSHISLSSSPATCNSIFYLCISTHILTFWHKIKSRQSRPPTHSIHALFVSQCVFTRTHYSPF